MVRRTAQNDLLKLLFGMIFRSRNGRFSGKTALGALLLAVLGVLLAYVSPQVPTGPGMVRVQRCVDGDTLLLEDGTRIRLIGANTPETKKPDWPVEPFGPEAAAFTKKAVEQVGNQVRLEYDGDQKDRYGRTLALVYVGETLLNEELIRQGLAVAELQYYYSKEKKDLFRAAEYEAQKARRGIWSLPER